MKSFAFVTAGAYGSALNLQADWSQNIKNEFNSRFKDFGAKFEDVDNVETVLEETIRQDTGIKDFIHKKTRSNQQWCPVDQNCQLDPVHLHWALCPNMCQMVGLSSLVTRLSGLI